MQDFVSLKEVAQRLHVSRDTVRRLVERGDLMGYRIGTQLRFTADDVGAYLRRVVAVPIRATDTDPRKGGGQCR